jgi:LemA protein
VTVLIIVLIIVAVGVGLVYNRLVRLKNQAEGSWADIDVQLKRRYDLIPNLVETVKGYASHERETLEAVIAARNQAVSAAGAAGQKPGDPAAMNQLAGAEGALSGALGRLFALAESYPDLKANQTMSQLMEELTSTENKVSFARQAYNDAVMTYNTAREVFPNSLVAGATGFTAAQLFELDEPAAREAPKVSFT